MKRDGFALPLAITVMIAVTVIAATAIQVALADFQANRSLRFASRALYAAEAGAHRTVARWTSGPFSALLPGDSVGTGWISLPDGSRYQSYVRRVDNGTRTLPLFRVVTEGRPGRTESARRQIITMVEASPPADLCCKGAITIRRRLRITAPGAPKPTQVDGRDYLPAAWTGYCPVAEAAVAGVAISSLSDLTLSSTPIIAGTPPALGDATITATVADNLGTTTYAALVLRANRVYTGNTTISGTLAPSTSAGVCNTASTQNWGAPNTPGSACWDYLPIIHAQRNLTISAAGQGQGILLVDGNLQITGSLRYYGLIVVKGVATIRGTSQVTGGLIVRNNANGNGQSVVRQNGIVRYGTCALSRVSGGPGMARFLPGRHWFEVP